MVPWSRWLKLALARLWRSRWTCRFCCGRSIICCGNHWSEGSGESRLMVRSSWSPRADREAFPVVRFDPGQRIDHVVDSTDGVLPAVNRDVDMLKFDRDCPRGGFKRAGRGLGRWRPETLDFSRGEAIGVGEELGSVDGPERGRSRHRPENYRARIP